MLNPPEPRPSARAWTFTRTSSPSATGPVRSAKTTHGTPSTSQCSGSKTLVTRPRLSESGIEQRERHVDHRVEVGDGDVLGRCVDVGHPVREVDALEPA